MTWPHPWPEERLVWETGMAPDSRWPAFRYIVHPDRLSRGTDHLTVALHDAGYGVLREQRARRAAV